MKIVCSSVAVVAIFLFGQHAYGQTSSNSAAAPAMSEPLLRAQLSSDDLTLGDSVYLFLTVEYPTSMTINLPATIDFGSAFEELGRTSTRAVNSRGMVTDVFEIALVTYAVGDVSVAPIRVTYSARGRAYEVESEPVPVRVSSFVGSGLEELRSAGQPISIVREDPRWAIAGGLVVLVIVVTSLVWRGFLNVAQISAVSAVPRRRRPPLVEARIRFAELEASGFLDASNRRPAYVVLSEIVREFVGDQFGFGALDLTTSEILATVAGRLEHDQEAFLAAWLRDTDLVKFAAFDASADEARQALYSARRWVELQGAGQDV